MTYQVKSGSDMVKRFLLMLIIVLFFTSCGPSQILGPTITLSPTITLTQTVIPKPTQTPTIETRYVELKRDLGIGLLEAKEYFERYNFTFESVNNETNSARIIGELGDSILLVLDGNPDMLVGAYLSIDIMNVNDIDSIPGLGDLVTAIFGQNFYYEHYLPWINENPGDSILCIDGYILTHYRIEEYMTISLDIRPIEINDYKYKVCEFE